VETDGTGTYSSYIFYPNGRVKKVKNNDYRDFDMDNSINITKKMFAKEDKINDITKPLEHKMYNNYIQEIEKIKISDFVTKYKSEYP